MTASKNSDRCDQCDAALEWDNDGPRCKVCQDVEDMSPELVDSRIIEMSNEDSEKAHILEDRLMVSVLVAIAGGYSDPWELARRCLESRKLKFSRWYS